MTYTEKDLKFLKFSMYGASLFSTCGRRQYMAIIVDKHGFICSTGYNGAPPGMKHCVDGGCQRYVAEMDGLEIPHGSSYANCISAHAEINALTRADPVKLRGATLYVNGPPCWDCSKPICTSGISKLVHLEDDSYVHWSQSEELFKEVNIEVITLGEDIVNASN